MRIPPHPTAKQMSVNFLRRLWQHRHHNLDAERRRQEVDEICLVAGSAGPAGGLAAPLLLSVLPRVVSPSEQAHQAHPLPQPGVAQVSRTATPAAASSISALHA